MSPHDLQTVHDITRPGDPSFSLQLLSRAPSAGSTPVFYGGDDIKGDVMLCVAPNEAQHVSSVEIEASTNCYFTPGFESFPWVSYSKFFINLLLYFSFEVLHR
jgi:hypothetical protein